MLTRIALWTFRSTMAMLTAVLCLVLIASATSDLWNPNTWIVPSFLGLGMGVTLMVAALWSVVMAVTRRWRELVVMAVTGLLIYVPASRLCPLHPGGEREAVTRTDDGRNIEHIERIHVLSYNTCLMGHARLNDASKPIPVMDEVVRPTDADIVCLQEYTYSFRKGHTADEMRRRMASQYPHYDYLRSSHNDHMGIALFTRYPILKAQRISPDRKYFTAMYYQLQAQTGTIGLVNLHLRSNQLAKEDRELYDEMIGHFVADSLQRIRTGMMRSLANAWRARAAEAQAIDSFLLAEHPQDMPLLICGDMNDTPVSYCHHRLRSAGLSDTWQEVGTGPGITYREHRFWFRIDHMLHNHGLRALDMKVRRDVELSDHYPIEATFQLLPQ